LSGTSLVCPRAHAFDRAREGYWNLLQPQDRRSPRAGDRDDTVDARRRWLHRGYVEGLIAQLAAGIDGLALPPSATVVDVGCGDGTLTGRLLQGKSWDGCGIDLSTKSIRLAARAVPALTWIVANADRGLPFMDSSVALALSIFGRRPVAELRRVLWERGTLIVVVPGEDDLLELRAASQGDGKRRDRAASVLAELTGPFELVARSSWRHLAHHDREAWEDALAMGYRGARSSERERLRPVGDLEVTLSAEILVLVPGGRLS
jgi:23S rRNA (guanine745-N1)-methyltransferase